MTREDALAIFRAGEDAAVGALLDLDARLSEALRALDALGQRISQLESRAAKDSHNSSKPPSSDGLAKPKPKPKSLRAPSQRKTGGQPGHEGRTLRMAAAPDTTVVHRVDRCGGCGASLAAQAPDRIERRQVIDVPEPKLEVTEHQGEIKTCGCGCVNRAPFPPEAAAPVQYGPRILAAAAYLKDYQLLPFGRAAEIMRDLFACGTLSQGTLANISAACAARLKPAEEAIRAQAAVASVAGFDETGMRAAGSLHWLHVVSTRALTWYFAHKKRGREAMDAAGILPNFAGRAVHDFWDPYLRYGCRHAFCNAHLLRELIFIWEEQGQPWAKAMIGHLLAIKAAADAARAAGWAALPRALASKFRKRCLQIAGQGCRQNPVPDPPAGARRRGRVKKTKARNLAERFRGHVRQILAFMYDLTIPFDNNLAERDLRMMKLRAKISGTFRSLDALSDFCRIRGYVSTARKNGLTALEALRRAFAGDPFVPKSNTS